MKRNYFFCFFVLLCFSLQAFADESLTVTLKKNITNITINPFLQTKEMQRLATIISNKGNTTDLSLRELYTNTFQEEMEISRIIKLQKPDGSFPDIKYDDPALSSWDPLNHISRLLYVARLYIQPNSTYYHRKEVADFLHKGLNAWYQLKPVCKNWWYNQIGVPKTLGVVVILIEDELSEAEKNNAVSVLNNSGFRMTGQNKVWLAGNVLLKALLINDEALTKAARDTIASEIFQTTNEGIQPDFSFHQHGPQQQLGNYGLAYINSLSYYANVFEGTKLCFTNKQLSILRNFALEGENWVCWRGYMDVSACNRQLFKQAQAGKVMSLCVAINQLRQADSIHSDQYEDVIVRNLKPGLIPELTGAKHFWRSDLSVFRSAESYMSVRCCSPRVKGTEFTNNENKKGHFISDGCTIFMRTGKEYVDIFPVWDWNRIPGVTAPLLDTIKPVKKDEYMNPDPFVGGLTSNGNGISVFQLNRNKITAKKSWFYLDGLMVCLGTDIQSKSDKEVVTTINQCLKNGHVSYKTTDAVYTDLADTCMEFDKLNMVWHDSIGYYFPEETSVSISNKNQSGDWHQIADPYSSDRITKRIFKLWINHGTLTGQKGAYQYLVLPAVSADQLNQFASEPTVEILANNASVQAVKSKTNNVCQMVFYKSTRLKINREKDYIESKTPGLVQLEFVPATLKITVSDPTQKRNSFRLKISGKYSSSFAVYNQASNETELNIPLPTGGEAGKSVTVELKN